MQGQYQHAMKKMRIVELDLLRFIAAMSVVLFHYGDNDTLGAIGSQVTRLGFLGVHVFFMISGFVILWTAMGKSPFEFVASRIARLYPSFWIGVAMTASVLIFLRRPIGLSTLLANLTMIPAQLGRHVLDVVYWSLVVEIKFYGIVLALLVTHQLVHIRWWLGLWLSLSVIAVLPFAPHWLSYVSFGHFSVFFIAGCYLYLIRTSTPSLALFVPLAVSAILGVHNALDGQENLTQDSSVREQICVAAAMIAAFGIFLAMAMQRFSLPQSRLWGWLGAMTYPLYLIHQGTVGRLGTAFLVNFSGPARVALMLTASLSIAWLMAFTIERNGCALIHRCLLSVARYISGFLRQSPQTPDPDQSA
jgi:peptidoglycan/LPS O-acetylase OafA/YrhL